MVTSLAPRFRPGLTQRIIGAIARADANSGRPFTRATNQESAESPATAATSGYRVKLIALFIAVSLSISFFFVARAPYAGNGHNTIAPWAFTGMVQGIESQHWAMMFLAWKPRVGAMWLAAEWTKLYQPETVEQFRDMCGWFVTFWFFGTLLLLVYHLKEPIFPMMAVFAGIVYALTVQTDDKLYDDVVPYPWDIPAIFFWALTFILWQRKDFKSMVGAIIFGTLFKESVAVLALLLFFAGLPFRRAVLLFGGAFFGCLLLHLGITHIVLDRSTLVTVSHDTFGHTSLIDCLKRFVSFEFSPHLNTILWANGGMMAMFFLLPKTGNEEIGILTVILIYISLLLVAEIADDDSCCARQWADCLPILAMYFQKKLAAPMAIGHRTVENVPSSALPRSKESRSGQKRNRRVNEPVFV